MSEPSFVIPTRDRCIDGMKHWFLTFKLGSSTLTWCKECGVHYVDNEPATLPYIYEKLAVVLKSRETGGNLEKKEQYSAPDDKGCISSAYKHDFKRVIELVTQKEPKESKVFEICTYCGTLTASRYKYQAPVLGTTNREKIVRSRRRVYVGYSATLPIAIDSDRISYTLVPDIYLKIEKDRKSKNQSADMVSKFWAHALEAESASWMEDRAQAPLAEFASGMPLSNWSADVTKIKGTVPTQQDHWVS